MRAYAARLNHEGEGRGGGECQRRGGGWGGVDRIHRGEAAWGERNWRKEAVEELRNETGMGSSSSLIEIVAK